jgi:hypothetical protein
MLALLLLGGCGDFDSGKDAKIPGEPLGTFRVTGALEGSSCGPGALGSTELWEFEVALSRDGRDLYWLNGKEAIAGRLATDGVSFVFDTRVAVDAIAAGQGRPGCKVIRSDSASGILAASPDRVHGFSARLRFGYSAQPGSDCSALIGSPEGFEALPCEMSYQLDGKLK